jgi:AbrB family looped-hinge helix DNA binding protein
VDGQLPDVCIAHLIPVPFGNLSGPGIFCFRSNKYIWHKWAKWVIGFKMPTAKVDDRGRVQLPSSLRHRMKLKEGDEFVAEDLGEDTIILKKINLRALLEDAIEKAKSIDLDKLEREIEEESNQLARQKFKVSPR